MKPTTLSAALPRARGLSRPPVCAAVLLVVGLFAPPMLSPRAAHAVDNSPPAILQWFESSYETLINRTPDVFMSGYGSIWAPPPYRADISDFSVGYDVYDRFDLGTWDRKTLYGTQTGLKRVANVFDRAGVDLHVDFVLNHNGYSGTGDPMSREAFKQAGGYPGFFTEFFGDVDGDYNSLYTYGDVQGRLAGLIDIDHSKNYSAVRSPVPGVANNVAAGTVPWNFRLANVPLESNRQFYPDIGHNTIFVYDPVTGEQNIPVHQFNLGNPMAGDPTEENATGYLMRNAQWLVQVIGVDGLRIDAAKHVEGFVLDFIDRSVYRQNPRPLLDGSTKHVFSYSEVFDANPAILLPHVKKTIDPNDPGKIGGNRDTMDFRLYYALKENLENAGTAWAWHTIRDAPIDLADDGMHNGSAGVKFVNNHDVFKPYALDDVAHAYVLMMPGNATVYFNGKEFGEDRDFPKDGRSDALSVGQGSAVTRLLEARNTHGRGNYAERFIDDQGLFAFERVSSALTLLSNRGDGGHDSRTLLNVGFAAGTYLVDLTGNASNSFIDPYNDIPEVVQVFEEGGVNKVNVRFPRNANANGDWHGQGFLVYGLPTPEAPAGLELSGVDSILAGDSSPTSNYENGRQRQSDLHVIKGDSFQVRLQTVEVNLLGSLRDVWADGDHALLKIDGGRDVNGNGSVDFVTPGGVSYGFEYFGDKSNPLIGPGGLGGPRGDGEFLQTVDATQLEEGYHFIEARAFRHRTDGGPAVFSSFKEAIYVDRLPPISGIQEIRRFGAPGDVDVLVESLDWTGDNVHVLANLHASVSDQEIFNLVAAGQGAATQVDGNLFKTGVLGVPNGNNVFTVVTFEATGTSNIQRLTGVTLDGRGLGLGDLNHDYNLTPSDVNDFEGVLWSEFNGTPYFNAAADVTADGLVTTHDLLGLSAAYQAAGAGQSVMDELQAAIRRRGNLNQQFGSDAWDIDHLYDNFGSTDWLLDLDGNGLAGWGDVAVLVYDIFQTNFGDVDLDGNLTLADFHTLRDNAGQSLGWAAGNFDGDSMVDRDDFFIQRQYFEAIGDSVALAEMDAWLASLQPGQFYRVAYAPGVRPGGGFPPAPFASAVPEPATLLLVAAGLLTLNLRRRRR